jgi:type I restriction enzyme, R subunit
MPISTVPIPRAQWTRPFTPEEQKLVADNVYAHVWQQAMSGEFAKAA